MIMAQQRCHAFAVLGTCALVALATLTACGSEAPQAAPDRSTPGHFTAPSAPANTSTSAAPEEEHVGSIALSLNVGGKQLDSMSYAIVGDGFSKSGSLDVSHSSKVSGIVGGIPFGNDYSLTLTGKGVGAAPLDCSGSTSFALSSVGPVPVAIQITCKELGTSPPPAAPVPPFAIFTLACALAALGVLAQRRSHSS
jgi:hypothetical protein